MITHHFVIVNTFSQVFLKKLLLYLAIMQFACYNYKKETNGVNTMGESNINSKLKNRRKELGLTMKEVAAAVGVSEGTVSRWESGNIANMGRDKIYALSKILKMT